MFLTTEPSIPGKTYIPLRVIFGTSKVHGLNIAIGQALAGLESEALRLEADGVIGVHLSLSEGEYGGQTAAVMGTAIKFQESWTNTHDVE